MPIVSAENSFKKGLEALVDRNHYEAEMLFRRAMDLEHQRRVRQPDMRYLSYYGLCRARGHHFYDEAIHACRRAARARRSDPDMFLNLGRVYRMAGKGQLSREAFRRGLHLEPGNKALQQELARAQGRASATVAPRSVNRFFRRVRQSLM